MREKNKLFINLLFITVLASAAMIQVILLNQYSTNGEKLTAVNHEIKEVEKVNEKLSQKIASASSIASISVKAQQLGLSKNSNLISLTFPLRVAYSLEQSL